MLFSEIYIADVSADKVMALIMINLFVTVRKYALMVPDLRIGKGV